MKFREAQLKRVVILHLFGNVRYYKEKILVLHVGGDGAASASVMATMLDKFSKDAWVLKTLAGVSTARGVA